MKGCSLTHLHPPIPSTNRTNQFFAIGCERLTSLDLTGCDNLEGPLPPTITNCTSLRSVKLPEALQGMDHLRFKDTPNALQFMYLATGGWDWSPDNRECWLQEGVPVSKWAGCEYRDTEGDALPTHFEFYDTYGHKSAWKPMLPIISEQLVEAVAQGLKEAHVTYKKPKASKIIRYHYDLEKMTQSREGSTTVRQIRAMGNGWQDNRPEKRQVGLQQLVVADDLAFNGVLPAHMFEPLGDTLRVIDFSCDVKPTKLQNGAVARPGMRVVAVTDLKKKFEIKAGDKGVIIIALVRVRNIPSMDTESIATSTTPSFKFSPAC